MTRIPSGSSCGDLRLLRSAARERVVGVLFVPALAIEIPARLAMGVPGQFVLGTDLPRVSLHGQRIQLHLHAVRGGAVVAEGALDARPGPDDLASFQALWGFPEATGTLSPDVVAWARRDGAIEAFPGEEWRLASTWSFRDAHPIVDHLNECHLDLMGLLVGERVASVLGIDPDGLLLETESRLAHVLFHRPARTAEGALEEIRSLVRLLPGARPSSVARLH